MNILIISDAWYPQVNGVVRTLEATVRELRVMGHKVRVHGPNPDSLFTFPMPFYPEIKLEFFGRRRLRRVWDDFQPDFVHVATEGPLGWTTRNLCLARRRPFTTAYHTRFPEYIEARSPVGLRRMMRLLSYAILRRFHAPSSAIMVATQSIEDELKQHHFHRIVRWSRGVDTQQFQPYGKDVAAYADLPRPINLYVGRVAIEKNIRAFLDSDVQGSKVVVGNGPHLKQLKSEYPSVHFLGGMQGEELGWHYAGADVFVFPSLTDTFGLVLLEACASGLKIASVAAPGPSDIFAPTETSQFAVLNNDLTTAIKQATALPENPEAPRAFVQRNYSWAACTEMFYSNLQAPTPKAIRRLTRMRNWLARWW
jgi:glycosyltransferase involved in cell wall biosynthesis